MVIISVVSIFRIFTAVYSITTIAFTCAGKGECGAFKCDIMYIPCKFMRLGRWYSVGGSLVRIDNASFLVEYHTLCLP